MRKTRFSYSLMIGSTLTLLYSLAGCFSGCPVIKVPQQDMIWMEPYETYSWMRYENQKGESHDLINLKIDTSCSPCNRFELGPNQYEEVGVQLMADTTYNTPSGNHADMMFNMSISVTNQKISTKSLWVFDYHLSFENVDKHFILDTIFCPALGRNLEAYLFDGSNPHNKNSTSLHVKTIHYSQAYGLVQYTTESDTFRLVQIK